jgi:hypothetical protein
VVVTLDCVTATGQQVNYVVFLSVPWTDDVT